MLFLDLEVYSEVSIKDVPMVLDWQRGNVPDFLALHYHEVWQ